MSSEVMAIVLRARIDDPAAKSVLVGLAEHAGPDGRHTYPSVPRLKVYTSLGESTVRRKLGELAGSDPDIQHAGLISVVAKARHHRGTEYAINLYALEQLRHPLIDELARGLRVADAQASTATYGGGQTSRSGRSQTSRSGRSGLETSRSGNQTSRSEQTDLPQRDPNRPLTVIQPGEEDSADLERMGESALASIARDQFGGDYRKAVNSPAFQRVFGQIRILHLRGDALTVSHPEPDVFDAGYLRLLEAGLANAAGRQLSVAVVER